MASVNKVIIIGNLGKDPEIRYMPSGDAVANITVATTDKWKDKQSGETKENTEWHRISFFGRLAEVVGQYMKKGSTIYVEGSLRTRKWEGQDGETHYSTEIRADSMQMLGGGSRDDGQGGGRGQGQGGDRPAYQRPQRGDNTTQQQRPAPASRPAKPAPTGAKAPLSATGFDDMDSDIPFVTCSMAYDMGTSKARRMARYESGACK